MQRLLFSIERALQVTALDGSHSTCGLALRQGRLILLHLSTSARDEGEEQCESFQMCTAAGGRIRSIELLRVKGPCYRAVDGGRDLVFSYATKRSPSALHWRSSRGGSTLLDRGELKVFQSEEDALVQLGSADRHVHSECVHVVVEAADHRGEHSMHVGLQDISSCSGTEAKVRVLMGNYCGHYSRRTPLPGANVMDLDIAPFAELELLVASHRTGLAILTSGTLQFDGKPLDRPSAVTFDGTASLVRLATQTGASVLWFELPASA